MHTHQIANANKEKSAAFPTPTSAKTGTKGVFQRLWLMLVKIWRNFGYSEQEKKEDYLRQMYYLALTDLHLSEDEQAYITDVGTQLELRYDRIMELGNQSAKHPPHFLNFPSRNQFFYVFHLINLIRRDEDTSWKSICRTQTILMKQGYAPDTVNIILTTIEHNEKSGISAQQTYDNLKESLG